MVHGIMGVFAGFAGSALAGFAGSHVVHRRVVHYPQSSESSITTRGGDGHQSALKPVSSNICPFAKGSLPGSPAGCEQEGGWVDRIVVGWRARARAGGRGR